MNKFSQQLTTDLSRGGSSQGCKNDKNMFTGECLEENVLECCAFNSEQRSN